MVLPLSQYPIDVCILEWRGGGAHAVLLRCAIKGAQPTLMHKPYADEPREHRPLWRTPPRREPTHRGREELDAGTVGGRGRRGRRERASENWLLAFWHDR
jgi:hypothetical protein